MSESAYTPQTQALCKSIECDQNLWDVVGVSMGRTQGVESHRTLGDYW